MPVLTAEAQLRAMVQASSEPLLTDDEITTLLSLTAVVDADGLAPTHDDWTATYDLNRAAAMGWEWKAGKVANQFNFSSEERSKYERSQVYNQCMASARMYKSRIHGTASIPGGVATATDPVIGNINA